MASFHNYVKLPEGIFALLPGSMYHVHHRMPLVSSNIAHWEMPLVVLMRKSIVQVGGTGPSRSYGWTRLSPHIVSLIVVKWSEEQQWLIPSRDHYSFDSEKKVPWLNDTQLGIVFLFVYVDMNLKDSPHQETCFCMNSYVKSLDPADGMMLPVSGWWF